MVKELSWEYEFKKYSLIKLINPKFSELDEISSRFLIDIDELMESYDLEQYPYVRKYSEKSLSVILDIPLLSHQININSIPLQVILLEDTIILISRVENREIQELDLIIEIEQNIQDAFIDIIKYSSNLFLTKLKEIKRNLDLIMQDVYKENNFKSSYEGDVQEMKIELMHYLSSLETNNMVLNQIGDLLFNHNNIDFEDAFIDSKQAYDICKLYLQLANSLFDYFNLHQDKVLARKVNRLTTLTISLTIPNMVFGFYGMNVKLPIETLSFAWLIITLSVLVISVIVYYLTKIDK